MHEATASSHKTTEHADAYLIDAERAARNAYYGHTASTLPVCQASSAGVRLLAPIDIAIGTKLETPLNGPVTLIGVSEHHAIVRRDDGLVEAVELGELANAFMSSDETFNHRLPVADLDTLAHLGHLMAELQAIDPDDVDGQTLADAKALRIRLAGRIEAVCDKVFDNNLQSSSQ